MKSKEGAGGGGGAPLRDGTGRKMGGIGKQKGMRENIKGKENKILIH